MKRNFFSFSLHERTQDAFVAWLCSCCNEPVSSVKHIVAEEFIKKLLGVNVNFQEVEVDTQIYDIDILLTLKNVDDTGNDYYVVIEDKINSQIHDNQLVKYIGKLIKAKGVSQDRIFVVYYKSGHVAKTPDCINLVNKITCQYDFDPNVKSEYQEVMSVTTTYPHLAGMIISDLDDIHNFFFAAIPSSPDADALFSTIMPITLTLRTINIIQVLSMPKEEEQIGNGRESSMNP